MNVIQTESASAWSKVLDDPKSRSVKDIIFLCSDNLKGLDKAVQATFPDSMHQFRIVHQIRNSLKFVSYKDRKQVMKSIKSIYQSSNPEMAKHEFEEFKELWADKYPASVKSWEENWDTLTAFLGLYVK